MTNHRFISFRTTKQHYAKIQADAKSKGFESVSDYVRSTLLLDDLTLHQRVTAIYNMFMGENAKGKERPKEKPLMSFIEND